jgi:hypothetical protein
MKLSTGDPNSYIPLIPIAMALADLGIDQFIAGYLVQVLEATDGNEDACTPLLLTLGALARARDVTASVEQDGQERRVYTLVPKKGKCDRCYICVDRNNHEWIVAPADAVSLDRR